MMEKYVGYSLNKMILTRMAKDMNLMPPNVSHQEKERHIE